MREASFYWAAIIIGAVMIGAFVLGPHEVWLIIGGSVLVLFGSAHGTLEKITANRDGLEALFQVKAIKAALNKAATATDEVTVTEQVEAVVTNQGALTVDAILSPAELVEVVNAVSAHSSTAEGIGQAFDPTVEIHSNE